MQTVKSIVRSRQQRPSSVEESPPRSSSASRRRSKSMITGQGTHFPSSHYRRTSRKDSGAFVQDDFVDAPGDKREKGHIDEPSPTGARESVGQQHMPHMNGRGSHALNAASGEDQEPSTSPQAARWKSASSETPRYEPQFQNDTAQGAPPPLRSSRQRSLGVNNENSAAVAAAASAYSGKPETNGRRVKSVPKHRPEETGVPRKDSTTIGQATPTIPAPVYVGEETEYVETTYGPSGTTETVDRETFVQGQPIQRETEVRTYQEPVPEEPVSVTYGRGEPVVITGEEEEPFGATDEREEPVSAIEEMEEPISIRDTGEEPISATGRGEEFEQSYPEKEVLETPEDEWDRVEEEEGYIEEQWQTGEQATPGAEDKTFAAAPTVMPPEPVPLITTVPGTSMPIGTDAAMAGYPTTTIPLGTEATTTGLPVTSMSIGPEAATAEPPATTMPSSPEMTTAVPPQAPHTTMPRTTKATTTEAPATKPSTTKTSKAEPPAKTTPSTTKKSPTAVAGTVPGTPWKVSDAWDMSKTPAKEYAGITTPTAPTGTVAATETTAATSERAGARAATPPEETTSLGQLGQEPADAGVTPGPRPSVGARSAQDETGAHAAMVKDQQEEELSHAEKKRIEKENKTTQAQKVKDDKLREQEVRREQDHVQQQKKEDEKLQKQAEKQRKKERKESKQQEKQQRRASTNGSQQGRRGSIFDIFRRSSRTSSGAAGMQSSTAQPAGA